MSDLTRTEINTTDLNREPTAQELAEVPEMTQQEMTEIIRSPEYAKSSLVQKLVAASLAKSDHSPVPQEEPQQSPDEVAAKQDTVAAMFRNPLYKSSAAYRHEVAQKVKALTANDNVDANTGQAITAEDFRTPGRTMRVSTSSSPYHGVDMRVSKFQRVETPPSYTGLEMPQAKKKAKPEPFPGV